MRFFFCAVLALALMPAAAPAQQVRETALAADALVYRRDDVVLGCGVRLTGGEPRRAVSTWIDVSFNVFRRGIALAQAIAYEIRRSDLEGDSQPARVPLQGAWLRTSDASPRLGENAERQETLVYALRLDDALALFEAVARSEPVTVGVKRWDERTDSVYSGRAEIADDARERLAACLGALAE
jgi:hypothetical protein